MLNLTKQQMLAGQTDVRVRFVESLSGMLSRRYGLPLDEGLRRFAADRRQAALALGFETDQQIADYAEACLLTQNGICTDPAFISLMDRPLMRPETKAAEMLRRWVWPHPKWAGDPELEAI